MKKLITFIIALVLLTSCTRITKISQEEFFTLSKQNPVNWTLGDCRKIIKLFSFSNYDTYWIESMGMKERVLGY